MSDSIQVRGRRVKSSLGRCFIFNSTRLYSKTLLTPQCCLCATERGFYIRWLVLEVECPWVSPCPDEDLPLKRDDSVIKRREKNSAGGRHAGM